MSADGYVCMEGSDAFNYADECGRALADENIVSMSPVWSVRGGDESLALIDAWTRVRVEVERTVDGGWKVGAAIGALIEKARAA